MDMTYNNLRGIEQFKNKLASSLQKRNISQDDIDKCVSVAVDLFGNQIGVMPVSGFISASSAVAEIEKQLGASSNINILDALAGITLSEGVQVSPAANFRLMNEDVREGGKEVELVLDKQAQEMHDAVEDSDNLISVMAYDENARPVKQFQVSSIDMIDYMEEEDLTDEGRRSLGFLPADFDSTDVLSVTPETETGRSRSMGTYGYDSDGELYIQSPSGIREGIVPVGAGTYMCLDTGEVFDVDLLLDDLNPEMN